MWIKKGLSDINPFFYIGGGIILFFCIVVLFILFVEAYTSFLPKAFMGLLYVDRSENTEPEPIPQSVQTKESQTPDQLATKAENAMFGGGK